jgi:hypothetical protein
MRIYILSDYSDYGADNVRATVDPAWLPTMLAHYGREAGRDEALARIGKAVAADVVSVSGIDLGDGWGGVQLHIVEAE